MRYMMFIKHTEDYRLEEVPQSLFAAMGEFVGEALKNGTMIDTAGLQPTKNGKRVRLAGGKIKVTTRWHWRRGSWTCIASTGRSSRASARCGRSRRTSRRSNCAAIGPRGGVRRHAA